ncbi:MAG: NAD(P)-dependent oxidoreductase [Acidimicrobiia bacterium]|nr:NAD(P)-dependent oxidoreductase [Acidimicrobiia bacterium]MDH4305976.1 NAD(P)-dependent oxidoreductase [Acidimicrobiia bacterium]MDH5293689.1 NAD(P)-dependent oxidoreductase [Acidimicrobiia bacterium]
MKRIGVIGLGVMGSAMSKHLLAAGYEVGGYDVVEEKRHDFTSLGGTAYESGAAVAANSDLVIFSLPTVSALEAATEDVVAGAHDGLIAAEMGVFPIDAKTRARDRLAEVNVELMDVPVSGTGLQAADATLVVMASGTREAFEQTKPVFDVVGRATYYLGPFPNGSVMKFIANLLVAVHNLSTAEAHTLGLAAGMDPAVVQQVIADGVGSSRIFEIRGPMMVEDVYEPPSARLNIILKDATIIRAFAESVGAPTPLLDAAIPVYESSRDIGLGDLDAAALCRYLEQSADIHRS